jgi:hypothetical protein
MVQASIRKQNVFHSNQQFCSRLMRGSKNLNGMTRAAVETLKEMSPDLGKECPLQGQFQIYIRKPAKKSMLNLLPKGSFRLDFQAIHRPTKNIAYAIVFFDIVD